VSVQRTVKGAFLRISLKNTGVPEIPFTVQEKKPLVVLGAPWVDIKCVETFWKQKISLRQDLKMHIPPPNKKSLYRSKVTH